jgi:hypothetical protein
MDANRLILLLLLSASVAFGQVQNVTVNVDGNGTKTLRDSFVIPSGKSITLDGGIIIGAPSLTGNNTWSGNNTFTGNVALDIADSITFFNQINIGTADYGWRYNPAGGGQIEWEFPSGGVAAFYETGSPLTPYMYFPGKIQADTIAGNIEATTLNSSSLVGDVPLSVLSGPLNNVAFWIDGKDLAGTIGVTYVDGGITIGFEPTPVLTYYYPVAYVTDGGSSPNLLTAQYRTRAQLLADLMPTATSSLDYPSIAAGTDASLTITVSGAATANTQTVHLGWSAALPAGVVVKQAYVSGANTVTITLTNISASAVDPAAITCRASVAPY